MAALSLDGVNHQQQNNIEPMKTLKNSAVRILWAWTLFLSLATATAHTTWVDADNIADLRTIDPSTDPSSVTNIVLADVPGYYQPADRGGGWFVWTNSSASDDGGAIIIPNSHSGSGRWMRILKGETPNVKMWGAKGDGSHNDTVNIQNALNGGVNLPFGEMLFPSGNYYVTNTLVFTPILHIRGEGSFNNTFVVMHGDHDVFETISARDAIAGTSYDGWDHGVIIEGMEIDCDPTSTSASAIAMYRSGEASVIRNIVTGDGGYGVRCFGGGAPGLRLEHVSCFGTHVANVCFDGNMPDGTFVGGGGSASLIGISGDGFFTTNSFIRVNNCYPLLSVYDFKAEASYGGGFIYYKQSLGTPYPGMIGGINIYGGTYNGSGTNDFIVLNSDSQANAPVYISNVQLYSVRYLIKDILTGRNIDANVGGFNQSTCRLPVQYESFLGGNFPSVSTRLTIGDSVRYDFDPPTAGWYRVIRPSFHFHMGGSLAINSPVDSSLVQFTSNPELDYEIYGGTNRLGVELDVTRASTDYPLDHGRPYVTMVRAGNYTTPSAGANAFVDIYVARTPDDPTNGYGGHITLTLPLEGLDYTGVACQLLTPSSPVADLYPTNGTLLCCVTNLVWR